MRTFTLIRNVCLILLFILNLGGVSFSQDRVYVVSSTVNPFTSIEDHDSWGSATSDLQAAINALSTDGGEIWLERGTYYPTESYYTTDVGDQDYISIEDDPAGITDPARCISFILHSGVAIIGGFNGESNLSSRTDYAYEGANATVLSGNIGDTNLDTDNAYHVVYAQDNTATSASLSDIIITDGNANGTARNSRGGGIQTRHGGTYNNLTIIDNHANRGGGVYAYNGGVFNNCLIISNNAIDYTNSPKSALGGGAFLHLANAELNNCDIIDNISSNDGGGVASSDGNIIQCKIINNECDNKGGGVYTFSPGGNYRNCLISNNTGGSGGGIYADLGGSWINCTVVNNRGTGGGVYSREGAVFTDVVFWGNQNSLDLVNEVNLEEGGVFTNCAIGELDDLTVGTDLLALNSTNTDANGPHFVSPSTVSGRGENSTDYEENMSANWELALSSVLKNTGIDDLTGLGLGDSDLAGNARVVQERIDIGAYELQYFEVNIQSTGNGTVTPDSPVELLEGENTTIELTPDDNHFVMVFNVDGIDRTGELSEDGGVYSYTISNIQADIDVEIQFNIETQYTIEVTGDVGGDVTPSGTELIYGGQDFEVTLDPSTGYEIRSVLVDGVEQLDALDDNGDGTSGYTIANVAADHTIVVDFALRHVITFNVSDGGTSSETGLVEILEGNFLDVILTPDIG